MSKEELHKILDQAIEDAGFLGGWTALRFVELVWQREVRRQQETVSRLKRELEAATETHQ